MGKISTTPFGAGDSILFRCGDTFYYGEMSKTQYVGGVDGRFVGSAFRPIVIASYGSGAKPVLYGDFTGAIWTKTAGYDSVWQAYAGACFSSFGWEYYEGQWHLMTHVEGQIRFYLNQRDSLSKYLRSLTASSYGPGSATDGKCDTIYVKTHDGLAPNVHIFRSNFLTGTYLTVRDLEFRNWWSAVVPYNGNYCTFRNLKTRNSRYISIFLSGRTSNSLVDSCVVDSSGYTALYSFGGSRNIFRYNTVTNVRDTILGISHPIELCGIGFQEDTACVAEYNTFDYCKLAGIDTYYNCNDTVRYNTITNTLAGIYLHGNGWVAYGNSISTTGRYSPGISVDNYGPRQTTAYNNTIVASGAGLRVATRALDATTVFYGNRVQCNFANSRFADFMVDGVTSSVNVFLGAGVFYKQGTLYPTLSAFQQATGYEQGSVFYSGAPTGTFTAIPDSLPAKGGTITLQWSSANATTASIDPAIGSVPTNGSKTTSISNTTLFTLTLTGPFGSSIKKVRVGVASISTLATVYDDSLNQSYSDRSWDCTRDLKQTDVVSSGRNSIKVDYLGWGGLCLSCGVEGAEKPLGRAEYDSIVVDVYSPTTALLNVGFEDSSREQISLVPRSWRRIAVRLPVERFAKFWFQNSSGGVVTVYFDNVHFVGIAGKTGISGLDSTPRELSVFQNYPNPFNPRTTIEFTLPADGPAYVKVYDTLGREVATLAEGMQTRGRHRCEWNGEGMASGVYFYRFVAGSFIETRRMLLVR